MQHRGHSPRLMRAAAAGRPCKPPCPAFLKCQSFSQSHRLKVLFLFLLLESYKEAHGKHFINKCNFKAAGPEGIVLSGPGSLLWAATAHACLSHVQDTVRDQCRGDGMWLVPMCRQSESPAQLSLLWKALIKIMRSATVNSRLQLWLLQNVLSKSGKTILKDNM